MLLIPEKMSGRKLVCSFWRAVGPCIPKIFNSDSPTAGNYPEKIIRQGSESCARMCVNVQGCSSESCYVTTECPALVKNNGLGEYSLLRREVHEMMNSETIVKQYLCCDPVFVNRFIPFMVYDIDIPSLYDRYIECMGRKKSGRI